MMNTTLTIKEEKMHHSLFILWIASGFTSLTDKGCGKFHNILT